MTTDANDPSTTTPALEQRLEAVFQELRRQGRASVAAQAAAEACLEALERARGENNTSASPGSAAREVAVTWLRELLPVFDALSRALVQARSLDAPAAFWERHWRPSRARREELGTLTEGLALVQQQLYAGLERLGVEVEAPSSGPPNPLRHRVVEVRASGPGRPGHIVEVVRPGYVLDGRVVREAEVAVRR